ncbi:EF-hand domain-containing protein [Pseudozobellia thermophila]|uniref:EF hand n=1 Tax=Pseudozobellia thermophila TaxID=192903 RepID=A0A1M6GA07_9FLAO|nr:hypothetical protein [Pseudozobellia thermophila]SHJ06768.1 EF hand [Pseudozobellia thermophila]
MTTKAILLGISASALFALSSNAQSDHRNQEPPSVDEIFEKMDKDEDGLLSEKEVEGPLKDMFSKIDSDEDGFLSKEEVEKAPKPSGKRPKRQ